MVTHSKRWSAATRRAINMADPSGHVPNNEFRERLVEKVQLNVTETGKLAQQLLKSSRSHEVNCTTKIWFKGFTVVVFFLYLRF